MKPYPRYKTIGLPWLDKIPAHWNVFRNKNFLHEKKSLVGDNASSYTLLSLTLNGIIARDMENPTGKFPSDFSTYKAVEPGDMVFCLFDMDETPRTVGLSNLAGMVTGAYDVFSVSGANPQFLYYYYLSIDNTKSLKPYYSGLRKVVPPSRFLGIPIPLPPPSEQDRIVRYLDEKTAAIDELVRAKEREIELLRERKQALVSAAVTGGLDPATERKDSGVPWIGKIPKGWNVLKLRQILSPVSEKNRPDLPLLSVVREKGVIIRDKDDMEENRNFIPDDLSGYKVVRKGQFVMNKMKAWQGSYGISPCDGIVSPAYFVFNIRFDNLSFFHFAIRSRTYVDFFAQASDGIRIGQWDLNIAKMKEIPFLVPPAEEQREIVERLPELFSDMDRKIAQAERSIALLQELRTRLVSDAVTGAVEVS